MGRNKIGSGIENHRIFSQHEEKIVMMVGFPLSRSHKPVSGRVQRHTHSVILQERRMTREEEAGIKTVRHFFTHRGIVDLAGFRFALDGV